MTGMEPFALAALAGATIYQGQKSASVQKKALAQQDEMQQQAQAAATRQERLNEDAQQRANRRKPDIGAMLASAQAMGKQGAASTVLTKPTTLLGA